MFVLPLSTYTPFDQHWIGTLYALCMSEPPSRLLNRSTPENLPVAYYPVFDKLPEEYSQDLTNVIRSCIIIDPSSRLLATDIYHRATKWLQGKQSRDSAPPQPTRQSNTSGHVYRDISISGKSTVRIGPVISQNTFQSLYTLEELERDIRALELMSKLDILPKRQKDESLPEVHDQTTAAPTVTSKLTATPFQDPGSL